MKIINENVSCITCKYTDILIKSGGLSEMTKEQIKEKRKACNKFINHNDRPSWKPAPGVKVEEIQGLTIVRGRPVETMFRRVILG